MQVFISYAREDTNAAQKLHNCLNAIPGVTVWLDKEKLLPGVDWEREILLAMQESRFMIILLSVNSVDKTGFVQREILEGLRRYTLFPPDSIFLIPARLDNCIPKHIELMRLNWVDLFPDWNNGLERITKVIQSDLERENRRNRHPRWLFIPEIVEEFREIGSPPFRHLNDLEIVARLRSKKNFAGEDLMGMDFRYGDLSDGDLKGANLIATDLSFCNLQNVNLKGANLERSRLSGANLLGANLWGANFWGADMTDVTHLLEANSLMFSNFYQVQGIDKEVEKRLESEGAVFLTDYSSFFEFFRSKVGLSSKELRKLFLWTQHTYFRGTLAGIEI